MDVDHRHAVEAIELLEIGNVLPGPWDQLLEGIHRHGAHVGIGGEGVALLALDAADPEPAHRAIGMELDLPQGSVEVDFAAALGDVVDDRLAEPLGWIAIEEGHLRAVALLQEAVEGGEHHRAGDLVGIDEIQRLGHGDEHLIIHPLGNVVQPQPFGPGILIAFLDVLLAAQHRRHQTDAEGDLLRPGEQVVVAEDRRHAVEGCGNIGEVEAAVGAGGLLLVEDHRVTLPLQPVLDVQLLEQLAHVAIRPEKDVQAGLVPVAVLVLPGSHLAAQHVPGLHHDRGVAGVAEVLGTGQTSQPSTSNGDAHTQDRNQRQP